MSKTLFYSNPVFSRVSGFSKVSVRSLLFYSYVFICGARIIRRAGHLPETGKESQAVSEYYANGLVPDGEDVSFYFHLDEIGA